MAKGNLSKCLPITLAFEGGWSNHPKDPGGATMNGVTQRTYDGYRRKLGLSLRSVKFMTLVEREEIYRVGYWAASGCETLLAGVDLVTFDGSVNSGVSRSKKWLASSISTDGKTTIQKYCKARLGFVRGLKTWTTFGKGWSRRIATVEANAVKMFLGNRISANAELKAEASKAQVEAKNNERAASGVGAGGVGAGSTDLLAGDPNWLFWGVAGVALIAVVAILIARRSHNKERAAAYAQVASE
ncbi:hypothetical protein AX761_22635 [Rhizobium sp. 58]|nr:hypothetical protein AX761_22635 [Rhizobium sp. 58]